MISMEKEPPMITVEVDGIPTAREGVVDFTIQKFGQPPVAHFVPKTELGEHLAQGIGGDCYIITERAT